MAKIRKSTAADINLLMELRFEMLREVNGLEQDYEFNRDFIQTSRSYFLNGSQTTVIAFENEPAGCASLCYIDLMPTFSHPTGKRAHLMNVYTREDFRRRGIGEQMVKFLIDEAKERGVTEISLDATDEGRFLYEKLGFKDNGEGMTFIL